MITSQAIFVNAKENQDKFLESNDCVMIDCNPSPFETLSSNPFLQVNKLNKQSNEIKVSRQEVKGNKFNELKKNTIDKMISRMQKYREDRMDKIIYGKQAILDNLKDEIYDVIKFLYRILGIIMTMSLTNM